MEFALHGLAEYSFLSKYPLETGIEFRDMMSSMLAETDDDEDDDFHELRDII
jgi:magnesium chelatase subunit I